MGLRDYTEPRISIPLGKSNSIEVRGLGLEDVSYLVRIHKNEVDALIEMFRSKATKHRDPANLDPSVVDEMVRSNKDELVTSFLQQFPFLAANVIAVASDEHDQWEAARRLPMPKQVEALVAIARLTFEDQEGFKKFVGNVTAVLRSARPAPQETRSKKPRKSTGSSD